LTVQSLRPTCASTCVRTGPRGSRGKGFIQGIRRGFVRARLRAHTSGGAQGTASHRRDGRAALWQGRRWRRQCPLEPQPPELALRLGREGERHVHRPSSKEGETQGGRGSTNTLLLVSHMGPAAAWCGATACALARGLRRGYLHLTQLPRLEEGARHEGGGHGERCGSDSHVAREGDVRPICTGGTWFVVPTSGVTIYGRTSERTPVSPSTCATRRVRGRAQSWSRGSFMMQRRAATARLCALNAFVP